MKEAVSRPSEEGEPNWFQGRDLVRFFGYLKLLYRVDRSEVWGWEVEEGMSQHYKFYKKYAPRNIYGGDAHEPYTQQFRSVKSALLNTKDLAPRLNSQALMPSKLASMTSDELADKVSVLFSLFTIF